MAKKKRQPSLEDLRLSPEKRLCPQCDGTSIRMLPVASVDEAGMRVLDNCAEENQK